MACLVMAVFTLGPAAAATWAGVEVIRARAYYEYGNNIAAGLAPANLVRAGKVVKQYRGADAVCLGVGLTALGAMLDVWGLALAASAVNPRFAHRDPDLGGRQFIPTLLTIVSLALLVTLTTALFPPWQIGASASATALYAEWLVAGIVLILPVTRHTGRGLLVPMVILAAMIVGWFSPGAFLGIGAGLFIGIGLAVHILMLFSTLPTAGAPPPRPASPPHEV